MTIGVPSRTYLVGTVSKTKQLKNCHGAKGARFQRGSSQCSAPTALPRKQTTAATSWWDCRLVGEHLGPRWGTGHISPRLLAASPTKPQLRGCERAARPSCPGRNRFIPRSTPRSCQTSSTSCGWWVCPRCAAASVPPPACLPVFVPSLSLGWMGRTRFLPTLHRSPQENHRHTTHTIGCSRLRWAKH
jgi:hypothetical protein